MTRLAARAREAAESETLRLSEAVSGLRAAGREVLSLLEGEPDLPVPPAVLAETSAALGSGLTRYSRSAGLSELREALARKLREENGVPAAPELIVVTNGAKQAIYEALQALCDPGDEVIVLSPYWVSFPEAARLAGARPVFVETRDGRPDPEDVARAVTPRTKALMLNTPNNPTGAVYTEAELRPLLELAQKRGFMIVSDEAYEGLVYDGARHVSPGALAPERVVTVQSFSKSFGMTGFRVGYLCAPLELARAIARLHGHVTGNVCTFAQRGALAALGLPAEAREAWRREHQRRRDAAFELGSRLFGGVRPEGGLFFFADARARLGARWPDSASLARHLLESAGVAVLPGSACGREGFLRVSFSASPQILREGFLRMERSL